MSEPKIPAWLEAKVDQRMAELRIAAAVTKVIAPDVTVIFSPLVEPAEDSEQGLDFWDNACDCCGKYAPDGLFTGQVQRSLLDGRPVILMFGVCRTCRTTFD